jgi:predicted MFS family arabinose efflux permease
VTQGTPATAAAEWRRYWPLVAATTGGMSLASILHYASGVMMAPIEQEFGWTRAQISSGPAVVSFMGLFLGSVAGFAIDRFGARRVGILVVLTMCTAIALLSTLTNSLWHWWAIWVLFGFAACATSTVWLLPVSTLFTRGRGMAIAVTFGGVSISMALVPPIAEYFIENHGWRSGFLGLAVIWGVVVLPLVLAFVPAIKPSGNAPADTVEAPTATLSGLTPREGFRSPAFYMILFSSFFSSIAGVAILLNIVPVLIFTGLDRTDAIWVAGLMGVCSIIGRLIGGWLLDSFNARTVAIFAGLCSLVLPIGLLLGPGTLWVAMTVVCTYALTGGAKGNAIVYLTSTHMGGRSFGLFYGTISTSASIAAGVGPLAANHIYDVTNSYDPMILATIPGLLISVLLIFALTPKPAFARERRADGRDG